MALDFDFSAVMQLLATKQAAELRRQELELARQQHQFDNAMRTEDRALRIAEHTERMALLNVQQDQAQFDLGVAKRLEGFQFRREKAQAEFSEGALEFQEETRGLRKEGLQIDVDRGKQELRKLQMENDFLGVLTPMQHGVTTALGENPTNETLARVGASLDKLPKMVQRFIPQKLRSRINDGGLKGLLGAPIGAILESRVKAGDLDTASVVMGASPYSESLASFISDEAMTAARSTVNRSLTALKAGISAIPTDQYFRDRLTSGSVQTIRDQINGYRNGLRATAGILGSNIFSFPEFEGQRNEAAVMAAEKARDLDLLDSALDAGQDVIASNIPAMTKEQKTGLDMILEGDLKNVFSLGVPAATLGEMAYKMNAAKYWPPQVIGPILDAAATSNDPLSNVRASMLWDHVRAKDRRLFDPILETIASRPGLHDRLRTMSMVRRSLGQDENVLENTPEGNFGAYALAVQAATELAMTGASQVRTAARAKRNATEGAKPLPDKAEEADLSLATDFMGKNEMLRGAGIVDDLDLDPAEIPAAMKSEFAFEMARYPNDGAVEPSLAARSEYATNQLKKTWFKPWAGTIPGEQADRFHPVMFARAQSGDEHFDDEFAGNLAAAQLYLEVLVNLKDVNGDPLRVRVSNVYVKPYLSGSGFVYRIHDRKTNAVYAHPGTNDPIEWVPDFTKAGLSNVWRGLIQDAPPSRVRILYPPRVTDSLFHEPNIFTGPDGKLMGDLDRTAFDRTHTSESLGLWTRLDRYLGPRAPDRTEERERKRAEKMEGKGTSHFLETLMRRH